MKFFKNELGRYQAKDKNTYFTCGDPVKYYHNELGWIEGHIEHNGNDYYFLSNDNKKFELYNGIELKDNSKI